MADAIPILIERIDVYFTANPCQIIIDENMKYSNKVGIDILHQTVLVRSWKDIILNYFLRKDLDTRPSLNHNNNKNLPNKTSFFIPQKFF
jgi:hypothetical protein